MVHNLNWHDFFDDAEGSAIKDFNKKRAFFRKKMITQFLNEDPGTGKKELSSQYQYWVENIHSNNNIKIYLKRPALLNKGFDFTVCFDGYKCLSNSGKREIDTPTHKFVLETLERIISKKDLLSKHTKEVLEAFYNCSPSVERWNELTGVNLAFEAELICKAVRWLYMEQDMAYWNYSGRNMLHSKISELIG